MFLGEKMGRVDMRKRRAETQRMFRAGLTDDGTAVIGRGEDAAVALWVRQ